jgi:hypothetical protein
MRARVDDVLNTLSRSPVGGFARRAALVISTAQRRVAKACPWIPAACCCGMGQRGRGSGSGLPTYISVPKSSKSSGGVGHGLTGFSMKEVRMMFKHFMSDQTSMRIFIFLTINFLFMFVELIYGFYSNSLGLISDAGHMLVSRHQHTILLFQQGIYTTHSDVV